MHPKSARTIALLAILLLLILPVAATNTGEQWLKIRTISGSYAGQGYALYNAGTYLLLVGGYGSWTPDVYYGYSAYSYNGTDFTLYNATAITPGRGFMGFATFNSNFWIIGGKNTSNTAKPYLNDTLYSPDGNKWYVANSSSAWLNRSSPSVGVFDGKLWLIGGTDGTNYFRDVWFLTTANSTSGLWTKATDNIGGDFYYGSPLVAYKGKAYISQANGLFEITNGGTAYSTTGTSVCGGTGPGMAVLDDKLIIAGGGGYSVCSYDGSTITTANVSTFPLLPAVYYSPIINFTTASTQTLVPWKGQEGIFLYQQIYDSTSLEKPNVYITVPPPVAHASPDTASGTIPYTVSWDGSSTGYKTSYEWDFKDGYTDDVEDASHIFSSVGNFNVSYYVFSPFGGTYWYSNVTTASQIPSYATAQNVRFNVRDLYGKPLPGVSISAVGVNSSVGSWDWLITLLGLPLEAAPIHNTSMACITDSFGSCTFMMIPTIQYQMTLVNSTAGISETYNVLPKDDVYEIWISTGGEWYPSLYDPMEQINITVTANRKNTTHGNINITYVDALAGTTGNKIFLNQTNKTATDLEQITISTKTITTSNFITNFTNVDAEGDSYLVTFEIQHSTFGRIVRTFAVSFEKEVSIGLPESWNIYLAVFFILFTGMFFGAVTSPTIGSILTCFVGWIMWGIGWMDDMGLAAPTVLVFATFISFLSVIMVRSRKERYL